MEREWRSNSDEKTGGKSSSEMQLKRSSPSVHHSLNWSVHLCELNDKPKSDLFANENGKCDQESTAEDGIIPLKQRIDSLNRSIEQTGLCVKKPKLLPKPLLLNQNINGKPEVALRSPSKISSFTSKTDASIRRERGRLDKSYSTPSYDYSIDSKEPLNFNTKLLEEKVKSAPDNITSDTDVRSDFKASLELKASVKLKKAENAEYTEYLEIKGEQPEPSDDAKKSDLGDEGGTLSSNIRPMKCDPNKESAAFQLVYDSLPSAYSLQNSHWTSNGGGCANKDLTTTFNYTNQETESIKSEELIVTYGNCASSCNVSQSCGKGTLHSTVGVPATFPRQKVELKKTTGPPEPPPRPVKGSPIHLKNKNSPLTKSTPKNISHKSPKTTRKKNILLSSKQAVACAYAKLN